MVVYIFVTVLYIFGNGKSYVFSNGKIKYFVTVFFGYYDLSIKGKVPILHMLSSRCCGLANRPFRARSVGSSH